MGDQNDDLANLDVDHDFSNTAMHFHNMFDNSLSDPENFYSFLPHKEAFSHEEACLDQKFCAAMSGKNPHPPPNHPHARSMSLAELPRLQNGFTMVPPTPNFLSNAFGYDSYHDAALSPDMDFSSMINTKSSPTDDCTSNGVCSSNCDECPSQCGASEAGDICHDADCGPVCDDDDCDGAASPCTDAQCLARSMDDTDKAAADVLASFPMGQSQMTPSPMSSMQSSQLFSGQTSFHDGGMPSTMGSQSLGMGNGFGYNDFLSSPNFMDMGMGLNNADWMAASNHFLQEHLPGHSGSGCVRPCLIDNVNHIAMPNRCPLTTQSHTHPGQEYFCTGQDLGTVHPSECGVELNNPEAWFAHIREQHPCIEPVHHPRIQTAQQQAASTLIAQNQRHSFAQPRHHGHMSISKDVSPETPSPMVSIKTAASPTSPMTPNTDRVETFTCKWKVDGYVCGKDFGDDEKLQEHCRVAHLKDLTKEQNTDGTGGFKCQWDDCSRQEDFTQKSKLERHLQTHTGFKPVKCQVCGLALSAKQSLAQHMRIHTGEKPWVCKEAGCGAAFKQQSALTMHMRTHTGEKPLQCDICQKRFGESSNLSKHRKTHNVKGAFTCELCGKDFHRLDQKRRHMKVHDKEKNKDGDGNIAVATSPDTITSQQPIRKMDQGRVTKGSTKR